MATNQTTVPPVQINGGSIEIAEDGCDVVLTLTLRIPTNDALDACLRIIAATARIKRMPVP